MALDIEKLSDKDLLSELDSISSLSDEQLLAELGQKHQPQKEVGLSGAGKFLPTFLTGQTPARGERTLLGNIFERPGAAVRSGLRGEGFAKGAAFPEEVESFQSEGLRKLAPKTESVALNFLGGLPISAGGIVLDILTNPADVLSLLIPIAPIPKGVGGGTVGAKVAATRPAKAVANFATKSRHLPFSKGSNIAKTNKVINYSMNKGVKPSLGGKKTSSARIKYNRQAREGVKTIVENQEILQFANKDGTIAKRLPENLDEFSRAITQTKKALYDSYDELLRVSGEKGANVNLKPIANQLDNVINSKTIKIGNPETVTQAINLKNSLNKQGSLSAKEANNLVQLLNQDLGPAYQRGFIPQGSPASIKATVADGLRKSVDETVSAITDTPFQVFKNKYSALKTIEADVNRAASQFVKRGPGGITEFVDVFAFGNIAQGLVGQNAAQVAKGLTIAATKQAIKFRSNPNRMIRIMFDSVSKTHTPNAIKIPSGGSSILSQVIK